MVFIEQTAGWAAQSIWTLRRRGRSLSLPVIEPRSLHYPGRNLDNIPAELLRFPVPTVRRFAFGMKFDDCVSTTAVISSRTLELGEFGVIMQAAAISVIY